MARVARKKLLEQLDVYSNGSLLGVLTKASTGAISFVYSDDESTNLILSRSLPRGLGALKGDAVANFFDNLLPDNESIRRILAQRTKAKSERPFDLLAAIGRDCVGSLLLVPHGENAEVLLTQESRNVSEGEIAEILRNLGRAPLGIDADGEFRISIAGAQEKTAFLKTSGSWALPIGATPTTHIFKVPMGIIQQGIDLSTSVENEWLCLEIFKAFGMPVARAEILHFEDQQALVTERFDRLNENDRISRLPQEDFCQALGVSSSKKYQADDGPGISEIYEILRESDFAITDQRHFLKAQVLNWLIGATDAHAKNYSVFLTKNGLQMTPLYDIMSGFPVVHQGRYQYQRLKLAMRITQGHYHMESIARRHFIQMAKDIKYSIVEMDLIIDEIIADFDRVISEVEKKIPSRFSQEVSNSIFEGMEKHRKRLLIDL